MYLKEEYYSRNNINMNFVVFSKRTFLVLYKKNDYRYIDLIWNKNTGHPGFFEFNYISYNHFNESKLNYGIKNLQHEQISFENYENFIINFSTSLKLDGFSGINQEENSFVMWKIFLKMVDKYIVDDLNLDCVDKLKMSINKSLPIDQRFELVYDIIEQLESISSNLYYYWRSYFKFYFENNELLFQESKWFLNLINRPSF